MQTAMLDTQMWWLPTADTARGRASPTTRRASSGPDSRTTRAPLGRTMIPGAVTLPTFYCGSSEQCPGGKKERNRRTYTATHTTHVHIEGKEHQQHARGHYLLRRSQTVDVAISSAREVSSQRTARATLSNFERNFSDLMTRSNFCHCGSVVFCFASMRFEVAGSIPL